MLHTILIYYFYVSDFPILALLVLVSFVIKVFRADQVVRAYRKDIARLDKYREDISK